MKRSVCWEESKVDLMQLFNSPAWGLAGGKFIILANWQLSIASKQAVLTEANQPCQRPIDRLRLNGQLHTARQRGGRGSMKR